MQDNKANLKTAFHDMHISEIRQETSHTATTTWLSRGLYWAWALCATSQESTQRQGVNASPGNVTTLATICKEKFVN